MVAVLRHALLSLLLAFSLGNARAAITQAELEPLSNFPQSTLNIVTPDARIHRIQVWVADTEAHREQGLMFVKALPENTGMLFIFDKPQQIRMWMKNTLIPLDMVFIDSNGRIDSIATDTVPMSEAIIDSKHVILGVLELAGGVTKTLGIRAGAIVQHPFFASVGGSR